MTHSGTWLRAGGLFLLAGLAAWFESPMICTFLSGAGLGVVAERAARDLLR